MQSLVLLTALLLGATASPIQQRETTQAKITNFAAGTNPVDTGAAIGYNLEISGLVSTRCDYSDTTSGSKLPPVGQIPCADPAVKWQFRQDPSIPGTEGRYRIVVIYTPATGVSKAGFHEWPATDFPVEVLRASQETVYLGASDFSVDLA
ncbi:hypothetical protein F4803DRAFT_450057 [Xylaria telfairii]|nr:hypothetical protein F4803DRAFT_450057 [Xylaria telfairii]